MAFQLTSYHSDILAALQKSGKNLVINAGPGSGKTSTGVNLVIPALIQTRGNGVAIAFNGKNAQELKARLAGYGNSAQASTVHSFCLAALNAARGRRVEVEVGWKGGFHPYKKRVMPKSPDKVGRIAGEILPQDKREFVNLVGDAVKALKMGAYGLPGEKEVTVETVQELIDRIFTAELPEEFAGWVVDTFNRSVNERATVDFNDQIYLPLLEGVKFPALGWVFYDEGQDCTPLNLYLLRTLEKAGARVVVVGDTRQAINGFAGAMRDALPIVADTLGAETLPLPVSYRCSKAAIGEANKIFPGSIEPGPDAKEGLIDRMSLADLDVFTLGKESACIARAHKFLVPLAMKMVRERHQFTYKGAADMVADFNRLIWKAAGKSNDCGFIRQALTSYHEKGENDRAAKFPGLPLPGWLVKQKETVETLSVMLAQVESEGGDANTLKRYFDRLAEAEKGEGVTLSTFHSSKGMEWESVFILGAMESPLAVSEDEKESERCVAFVALTRSSDRIVYVEM